MDRGLSWDLPPQSIVLPHHSPNFHHTPNLLPREMERNLGSHSSAQLFPPSSLSLPLSTPIPAHYMPWAPFLQNASSRTPPPVCTLCYQWLLISHRLTPKFLGIAGKGLPWPFLLYLPPHAQAYPPFHHHTATSLTLTDV